MGQRGLVSDSDTKLVIRNQSPPCISTADSMLSLTYTKRCEHCSRQCFSKDGGMSSVCSWSFLSHNAIPADLSLETLTKEQFLVSP